MGLTLDQAQEIYDRQLPEESECDCSCGDDVICSDCGEHATYCKDCGGTSCCNARAQYEDEYEVNEER